MEKFFSDVLLEDYGIFVLFGSKPMISTDIVFMSQEELDEFNAQFDPPEEELIITYDLSDNWLKWEKIREKFPIKRYLFFIQDYLDDPRIKKLYLIDVMKTAQTIQEHYETFRRILGYDFDPFKVVPRIKDKEDPFWRQILYDEPVLFGILMGYGEANSWAFRWYIQSLNSSSLEYLFSCTPCTNISAKNKRMTFDGKPVSPKHFPIPNFRSFADPGKDEIVLKYKAEREEIKKMLKKGNFLTIVLEQLTSKEFSFSE